MSNHYIIKISGDNMLINFRFKNVRSFYQETNLSLLTNKEKEFWDTNTFSVEDILSKNQTNLLNSAIIFGPNGSGKSNVLKALAFMKRKITFSKFKKENKEKIRIDLISKINSDNLIKQPFGKNRINQPFAFYENAHLEESLYEVEFIQNHTYYKYGFCIKDDIITSEWLDMKKERLIKVFTRDNLNCKFINSRREMYKEIKLKNNSLLILKKIPENDKFPRISKINSAFKDVIDWFEKIIIVIFDDINNLGYLMFKEKYLEQTLDILKLVDPSIKKIEIEKNMKINFEQFNNQLQIAPERYYKKIPLIFPLINPEELDLKITYNVYDKNHQIIFEQVKYLYKDYDFNSKGIIRLISYLGLFFTALDKNLVLLIDDLDSIFPLDVAKYLIKLFKEQKAQLVCTAYNIMLMDDGLRRDQIYFTNKEEDGTTKLVRLSNNKNVRKNDIFSKKYLASQYINLPKINK